MADKKIIAELEVQTGQSRQNLQAIQDELSKSGDAGVRSASAITRALENIENAEDKVTRKITEGRTVTVRDGAVMAQQFEVLRTEIVRAFGAIENAPAAVQQAFAKAQTQVTQTQAKVKDLTTASNEQRAAVAGNANEWGGLTQQLIKADPRLATIITRMGGVTAAFVGGWAAGQKLNQLFGTDMSLWEENVQALGLRVGIVVHDISDVIIEGLRLIGAAFRLSWEDVRKSAQALSNDVMKMFQDAGVAVSGTNKEVMGLGQQLGLQTDLAKKAGEALGAFAEKQRDLTKEINATNRELRIEQETLDKLKSKQMEASHAADEAASSEGYFRRQLADATSALEAQRLEVEKLTAKYGAQDPVTRQAIERADELARQVQFLTKRHDESAEALSHNTEEAKRLAEEITRLTEKQAEQNITKAQELRQRAENERSMAAALRAYGREKEAQELEAKASADLAAAKLAEQTALNQAKEAAEKAQTATQHLKDETLQAKTAVHDHGSELLATADHAGTLGGKSGDAARSMASAASAIVSASQEVQKATEPFVKLAEVLHDVVIFLNDIRGASPEVAQTVIDLGKAAGKALGSEHAGEGVSG